MFNDAQIYNGWIQRTPVDMKSNKGGAHVGGYSMRVIDPETRVNGTRERERRTDGCMYVSRRVASIQIVHFSTLFMKPSTHRNASSSDRRTLSRAGVTHAHRVPSHHRQHARFVDD
jgi:hypothetical protein